MTDLSKQFGRQNQDQDQERCTIEEMQRRLDRAVELARIAFDSCDTSREAVRRHLMADRGVWPSWDHVVAWIEAPEQPSSSQSFVVGDHSDFVPEYTRATGVEVCDHVTGGADYENDPPVECGRFYMQHPRREFGSGDNMVVLYELCNGDWVRV